MLPQENLRFSALGIQENRIFSKSHSDFNRTISSFALGRSIAFFCGLTVSGLVKSKMFLTITRVMIKESVIALNKACASFLLF